MDGPQPLHDHPAQGAPQRDAHLPGLLTIRIIDLLDLLRRSGTLANRREFGITSIEWRILSIVGAHAHLSLNDLAELLAVDTGQVSRAVKALVERGLLTRKRKPGGPSIVIGFSEEGERLHVRMAELAVERNAFLVRDIPAEEIERVAAVLDTIRVRAATLLEMERNYGGDPDKVASEQKAARE